MDLSIVELIVNISNALILDVNSVLQRFLYFQHPK